MQNENDILTNIASEVARIEADIRAKEAEREADMRARVAELEGLRQAAETIRIARGTGIAAPMPPLPPAVERRSRARSSHAVAPIHAPLASTIAPGAVTARIRELLEQRSMTSLQLAASIGTTPELMQSSLDALQRDGQVYRFGDGAYSWVIGDAASEVLTATIKRFMIERHVSRRDIMRAIGVGDKLLEKRVDNQLDYVRETELVWGQKDAEGHWVYWLVAGQKPPRELDGRKPKRVRAKTSIKKPLRSGRQR